MVCLGSEPGAASWMSQTKPQLWRPSRLPLTLRCFFKNLLLKNNSIFSSFPERFVQKRYMLISDRLSRLRARWPSSRPPPPRPTRYDQFKATLWPSTANHIALFQISVFALFWDWRIKKIILLQHFNSLSQNSPPVNTLSDTLLVRIK